LDKILNSNQQLTKNVEYEELEYSPHLNIEWPQRLIQFKFIGDLEGIRLKRITCLKSILKGKIKVLSNQIFFFRKEREGETFYYFVNVCPDDKYLLIYNNAETMLKEESATLSCSEALKTGKNVPNIYEIDISSKGREGACIRSNEKSTKIREEILKDHQSKQEKLIEDYYKAKQVKGKNVKFLDILQQKEKRKFDPDNKEHRYSLPDKENIEYLKNIIYKKTEILPTTLTPEFINKIVEKFYEVEKAPFNFLVSKKVLIEESKSESTEIDEEKKFRELLLIEHLRNELNKRIYNPKWFPKWYPLEKADPNEDEILDRMFNSNKRRRLNEEKGETQKAQETTPKRNSLENILKIKQENFGKDNSSEEMKFQNLITI
uniref:Uncharacterized protein n=1 Tax=Meloidogyne floridensis TaxID=298350 RepID=A0A915NJ12_9BILA